MTNWVATLTGETQGRLLSRLRRAPETITALAAALQLTDNAVRNHIAALVRDGIVEDVGVQRDTGGKPARLYGLSRDGEELFPKAYAVVLAGVIEELVRQDGSPHALDVLRAVGRRVGESVGPDAGAPTDERVAEAAQALRGLGADIDVERTDTGWRLRGYACPLSAVSAHREEVCALAQELVATITGRTVVECCQRGDRPRCGFLVEADAPGSRGASRKSA